MSMLNLFALLILQRLTWPYMNYVCHLETTLAPHSRWLSESPSLIKITTFLLSVQKQLTYWKEEHDCYIRHAVYGIWSLQKSRHCLRGLYFKILSLHSQEYLYHARTSSNQYSLHSEGSPCFDRGSPWQDKTGVWPALPLLILWLNEFIQFAKLLPMHWKFACEDIPAKFYLQITWSQYQEPCIACVYLSWNCHVKQASMRDSASKILWENAVLAFEGGKRKRCKSMSHRLAKLAVRLDMQLWLPDMRGEVTSQESNQAC